MSIDQARWLEHDALRLCDDEAGYAEALPLFEAALEIYREGQFPSEYAACLTNTGICLDSLGRRDEALDRFAEALPLALAYEEAEGQATCLMATANCLDRLRRGQDALLLYQAALALFRKLDWPEDVATCLMNMASCCDVIGQHDAALAAYREAVILSREYWPPADRILLLQHAAFSHTDAGQWEEASRLYDELLPIVRAHHAPSETAAVLIDAASNLNTMGGYAAARVLYEEALPVFRATGPTADLASCLMNLANCLDLDDRAREALGLYEEALPLYRAHRSALDTALCLTNLATCLDHLGRWEESLVHAHEAQTIYRADGQHPRDLARSLMNSAGTLADLVRLEAALARFDEALSLYRIYGTAVENARCQMNSATCLMRLGRYQEALGRWERALALIRTHPPVEDDLGRSLMGAAICHVHLGHHDVALTHYEEALARGRTSAPPGELATRLMNTATCLEAMNRHADALALYEEALPLYRAYHLPDSLAMCLINRALCHRSLGRPDAAWTSLGEAAGLLAPLGPEADGLRCLLASNRANLHWLGGDPDTAWGDAMVAMDLADRLAGAVQDQINRTGLRANMLIPFQLGAAIALARGEPEAAFTVAQRAKGRTLTELLERRGNLTGLDRRELLLIQRHDQGTIADEDFATGIARIHEQRSDEHVHHLGTDPRRPVALPEIAASLHPGEALLDAFEIAGDATLILFLVLPGAPWVRWAGTLEGDRVRPLVTEWQKAHSAYVSALENLGKTADERKRANLRETLDVNARRGDRLLAQLGALLLGPVAPILTETGATTLIISPSGLLHRLPLAALRLPDDVGKTGQPLIDRLAVHLVPTASSLALVRDRGAPRLIWPPALLAAAPFCGPEDAASSTPEPERALAVRELMRADGPRVQLDASRREIATVARVLAGAGDDAPVALYQGQATRAAVIRHLPSARIVHLSTHGGHLPEGGSFLDYAIFFAEAPSPDKDAILVNEVYEGKVPLKDVFSVCLSACDLGEVVTQGAEALGFAQAFLQAGAGVILAPIWKVEDSATAQLMINWYEALTRDERPNVAEAWRQAVLRLKANPRYVHPFFWAGFLPNGDGALRLGRPSA